MRQTLVYDFFVSACTAAATIALLTSLTGLAITATGLLLKGPKDYWLHVYHLEDQAKLRRQARQARRVSS
jgi:hypothetical protein